MLPIEQLVFPIADALQMDMEYKWSRLYGEGVYDLGIVPKVPIVVELKIVDSIVDTMCSTVGVLAKFKGSQLYLAMINDDRTKELTFFVVDGAKAGINYNLNTGRVAKM
ncbi:MAG: hypothetical protein KAJ19_09200, partial [Gammaproteobacteria bacterium]|nr:hypothetical protein [Gammaproteobacteria bacterium]